MDVCWRLQQHGHRTGFSPGRVRLAPPPFDDWGLPPAAARATGGPEALLALRHPEYFKPRWAGASGADAFTRRPNLSGRFGKPIIYHGLFGTGFFSKHLSMREPAVTLTLCTTLEYHLLVTLPLWVLSGVFHSLFPVAFTSLLIPLVVCGAAGLQASLPRKKLRWWSRALVALLFFLQPIVRGVGALSGSFNPAARLPAGGAADFGFNCFAQ